MATATERAGGRAAGFRFGQRWQRRREMAMRAFNRGTSEFDGVFDMATAAFAGALGVVRLLRHSLDFSTLTIKDLDKFG